MIKEYQDIYFGRKVKIIADLTEQEYKDICSMAKNYGWNEVTALRVYRGIHDKTLWNRVQITTIQ